MSEFGMKKAQQNDRIRESCDTNVMKMALSIRFCCFKTKTNLDCCCIVASGKMCHSFIPWKPSVCSSRCPKYFQSIGILFSVHEMSFCPRYLVIGVHKSYFVWIITFVFVLNLFVVNRCADFSLTTLVRVKPHGLVY